MYVITGATGNTGKIVAQTLLKSGKAVTVVGRSEQKLKPLLEMGATLAVGNLEESEFLTKSFEGATAVYALIPPNFQAANFRSYQNAVGNAIVNAVKNSGIKYVVSLSSLGAHLPEGSGVLKGLYDFEQAMAALSQVNAVHLRAGFFMENFFGMLGTIKHAGVLGGFPIRGDIEVPMIATQDIGEIAARYLLSLNFKGQIAVSVANSERLTLSQAATIIGQAIGKPDLKYVQFQYEQAKAGMIQMGASQSLADAYEEFSQMMNERYDEYRSDYKLLPENTGRINLREFAAYLAGAYQAK
jgi:uncharacterized protein YbjT (DUF2867 family)